MDEPSRHPAVAALEGRIPRPGIDLGYRLGLMLVAISMVLLPLIYIALILAVGYGLYIYVRVGPGWVGSFPIGGFWRLVGLVSPEADLSIRAADFGLEKAHVRAADRVIVDAQAEVARVVPDIDAYLEAAANWLAAALRLLAHPRGREAVARAGLVDRDIQPLLEALACLRKAHGQFLEVRETYIALTVFLQSVGTVIPAGPGVEKLDELTLQLKVRLRNLEERLDAPYPFEHVRGPISIRDHVIDSQVESEDELEVVYAQASSAQERYPELYLRLLGTLTKMAQALEGEKRTSPRSELHDSSEVE